MIGETIAKFYGWLFADLFEELKDNNGGTPL